MYISGHGKLLLYPKHASSIYVPTTREISGSYLSICLINMGRTRAQVAPMHPLTWNNILKQHLP
jgi:hypothetical protein